MEQNLENDDSVQKIFSERVVNVKMGKKCNLCDASSHAGHLKEHLKMHIGIKSNKYNQCDYASSRANSYRRHLKTHSGEKKLRNATSVNMPVLIQAA